ncbi:MAG: GGDEF domain-containing protein [Proteobacteria bacterium]|nr:GGDEF domain-containing protein [Pseudomonadota bacterium]MBU1685884.1 GGDEF domain-containing protein [Pseudomonadota bacterium]
MHPNSTILEMLSLIYEDLDIDTIEERFVSLVAELFPFDRVGLFFVKHKKGLLQGKLCRGFGEGSISTIEAPIDGQYLITRPLVTGFPVWNESSSNDPFLCNLNLNHFALIPVVNRKRIPCWQITDCRAEDCPAYGRQWLRCWLVTGTKCKDKIQRSVEGKTSLCTLCPVFTSQDNNAVEGIMLVDGQTPIDDETVTILSIIAHGVGSAINNSKKYTNVLRESIRDDLTGLHNRRYFNERLLDEIERARRYGGKISLLFGDIDHFKNINDQYGHPTGDAVLQMIAAIFNKKLRHSDIVARYGGEEFAVLLFDNTPEQAKTIAEGLRLAVEESTLPTKDKIGVTISFGIAWISKETSTLEGLIGKADKALYSAKAQGRNRICMAPSQEEA